MSKGKVFSIVFALILVGIGTAILIFGFMNKPKTETVTKTYEITDNFNNIDFDIQTADVKFEKSDDGKNKAICVENKYVANEFKVENDTLKISSKENRKWYEFMLFNFTSYKITLYLVDTEFNNLNTESSTGNFEVPASFKFNNVKMNMSTGHITFKGQVDDKLKLTASTGKIDVDGVNASDAEIKTSTGDITLTNMKLKNNVTASASTGDIKFVNVTAKNITISTSTGDIDLVKSIAEEHMELAASTGHIHFDEADAKTIKAKTTTGRVYGVLNTPKTFYATSDTGKVSVPRTTGGECEISTHTGSITITIKE